MRTTIDFGIDLGTTNSAIALLKGTSTEIIKNSEQSDLTPSAIYISPKGNISVGINAKDQIGRGDVAIEFKRKMGTSAEEIFKKANRSMKPEDLSAEILKSLKNDVKRRFNEDLTAAAITVPAAFEMPQCEATQRAARLAGINLCPLLQEPVAASLTYGFQGKEDEKEIWLVYDFGGGTFDAALMQMRDGIIQVLAHKGDNHLGGGLIDDAIVEQILIPELVSQYKLTDFRRGNSKWNSALAKIKSQAEKAKITLSSTEFANITLDDRDLGQDENGEAIYLEFELTREDVARLAEPYIRRSVAMSRELLREKKLGKGNISKVLLVGGPTFAPYLRDQLSDDKEGLGIALDFSQDPMTVVARGAAIFAGTQRLKKTASRPSDANTYSLQLEYEPIGIEPDPFVAGKVIGQNGETFKGFTIEFINESSQPAWRSGKTPVNDNGGFATSLWAQKDIRNEYKISLFDQVGTAKTVSPDSMTYTIGSAPDKQPLLNDISIALKNNETDVIFEKGSPLPLRKKKPPYIQPRAVKKDNPGDAIRIPIVEGRISKADRNKSIGIVEISSSEIKRDLPANSEIEITFLMDESRTIDLEIYIPVLDQEFSHKVNTSDYHSPTIVEMADDFNKEEERLNNLKEKIEVSSDSEAERIFTEIEQDQSREIIAQNLQGGGNDDTAQLEAFNRLLDLRAKLDQIEDKLQIPMLEEEAAAETEDVSTLISQFGEADDRRRFIEIKRELQTALKAQQKNIPLIRERIDDLHTLKIQMLARRPEWWIGYFEYLESNEEEMTDRNLAARLITAGRREINNGQLENLQNLCMQLVNLLPADERNLREGYGSTIMRIQ